MGLKIYSDDIVTNVHLDIAKAIARHTGLDPDDVGVMYVRCKGKWDLTINILYIMMKERCSFERAVHVYKMFLQSLMNKKSGPH